MKYDHGGSPEASIDASVNLNPLGPPGDLDGVFARARELSMAYPEIDAASAREAWAERLGVPVDRLLVGNGASELISLVLRAIAPERVVLFEPCYSEYLSAAEAVGADVEGIALTDDGSRWATPLDRYRPKEGDLVILGQPNNPTGHLLAPDDIVRLAASGVHVLVDESFLPFLPFLPGAEALSLAGRSVDRVSVVCSLTKVFCVPGLRLGWLAADSALMSRISRLRDPWSVNGIAVAAASVLATQDSYLSDTRGWLRDELPRMRAAMSAIAGLRVSRGDAPFVLAELPEGFSAGECRAALIEGGIAVRDASTFGGLGPRWIRVGLRTAEENARIVSALSNYIGSSGW